MIPPRMLSNENEFFGTGNGLKSRVTACRKRIRLNRFQRAHLNTLPGERLLESASGSSERAGYLRNKPAVNGPLIQAQDRETSQRVTEQEVGKT